MVTGQDLVALGNKHLNEAYVLGAFAPKDNPNWRGPWDCAEFVSWLTFQCTGSLLGCTKNTADPALADAFSGAWARDAKVADRRISIGQARATAGAVLVRRPTGSGIGHVVISRGDGTTVEAHSRLRGVTNDKVDGRHWDLCMLLPDVQYPDRLPTSVFTPPAGVVLSLKRPPMRSRLIEDLQKALQARGFDPGEIDGEFGPHTEAAVLGFQLANDLVADGQAGPVTLKALGLA
jgi:hypothetical protein